MLTDYEILKVRRRQLQNFLPWGAFRERTYFILRNFVKEPCLRNVILWREHFFFFDAEFCEGTAKCPKFRLNQPLYSQGWQVLESWWFYPVLTIVLTVMSKTPFWHSFRHHLSKTQNFVPKLSNFFCNKFTFTVFLYF